MKSLKTIWTAVLDSLRDLLPIIVVIGFFQFAVLQQPIPNLGEIVLGVVFVVIGLTLFVQGLNMGARSQHGSVPDR
jgi:Na+/phosphate symporter